MTLFPELIESGFGASVTGRALQNGTIALDTINIRDYAKNKHKSVDDYPYGGGAGMVMQAEPVYLAYQALKARMEGKAGRVIYLTPQGRVFSQRMAEELACEEELVFLCGHYEGIDERVLELIVTDYVSIGDYVLTGGELPALVVMDAVARLVPQVLNNEESARFDSFHDNLLEHPQYTRPEEYMGLKVPEVLLSGNHAKIESWRREQSLRRTKERRPELLENNSYLTERDKEYLKRYK